MSTFVVSPSPQSRIARGVPAPSRHILVLVDRDWTHPQAGGTGTNLWGQAQWWLAAGHRVTVIAGAHPDAPAREDDGRLTVMRMGTRATVFPRAIARMLTRQVEGVDVVLEVINGVTFLTPLWLSLPRVALVHHVHRRNYTEEMGRLGLAAALALETAPLRLLYRRTRFLTVSHASAQDLEGQGIPRDHIEINHNGVDRRGLYPGVKSAEPTLLVLGRLKRYKRIELVLDALASIPQATLDVAGEGDHHPALERDIAARGLGDRVRLHGFVDTATRLELLQRSWVHVSTSAAEGWCLAVSEAAACATPSAALAVGGLRESIVDECTGLLAHDVEHLTRQLQRLMGDDDLRRRMGEAALTRVSATTWRATAQRTLGALEAERARFHGQVPRPLPITPPRGRFACSDTAETGVAVS